MLWGLLLVLVALIFANAQFNRLSKEIKDINLRLKAVEKQLPVSDLTASPRTASEHPASTPNRESTEAGDRPQEDVARKHPQDAPPGPDWEKIFAEHWLVWLGGLTLALGGAFLVKFSIDYGLLTPSIRVAIGIVLGLILAVGSDWIARRDNIPTPGAVRSYIPAALAAAGTSILFASIFAAYALYGLFSSAIAFSGLAAAAALALILSLRHGPFVAGLGLLGAFAVPLLVSSQPPSAAQLFIYLAVVDTASLALLRHKSWPWLAWVSIAACAGWTLFWLAQEPGGRTEVAVFLSAQFLFFTAFRWGFPSYPPLSGLIDNQMVRSAVRTAFWMFIAIMLVLIRADRFGGVSLSCAILVAAYLMWFAYHDPALDDLLAAPALLMFATLGTWSLPAPVRQAEALLYVPPEQVSHFTTFAIAGGLLLGVGGFLTITTARHPVRWAWLSATACPVILALSYWRLETFDLSSLWAFAAVTLAGFELAAAHWAAGQPNKNSNGSLAAYAVGVLACTILAATFELRNAWLTVALSLHLPAIAWVERRMKLAILRKVALALAIAVLVRLVLNPEIAKYPLSDSFVFNWLLYGYGLPTAAFIAAMLAFGRDADDLLVEILEGGSAVFLLHCLRSKSDTPWGAPPADLSPLDFQGTALQVLTWLAIASGLLYMGKRRARRVLTWGGIALFALATLAIVVRLGMELNPLFHHESVGPLLLFDLITLAFGIPSLIYFVIAKLRIGPSWVGIVARAATIALGLTWVTFEVRHGFRGSYIAGGHSSDAEWYAYSVAWLLFAAFCIGIGSVQRNVWLRRTGLAGMCLVIAKVFISDMSQLEGLWRALSFLGLGGVLVAIGYIYRLLDPSRHTPVVNNAA